MEDNNKDSLKTELKEGSGIMEGVEIAIFNEENKILLGKRLASAGFGTWNFPGGHLKTNEKISECARREIREELGRDIKIDVTGEIISVRENAVAPHHIHHVTIILKGIHKKGDPKVNEPDKCEKWEWFELDNLPTPLFSGVEEALANYAKGISIVVSDW
jgi:8-oxo-dGTP diphosphatase